MRTLLLVVVLCIPSFAAETRNQVIEEKIDGGNASITKTLADSARDRNGVIRGFLHKPHRTWNRGMRRLKEKIGLQVGFAYTALGQWATNVEAGPDSAASGDLDIFGEWIIIGRGTHNTGKIGFWIEERHGYTDLTPNQLGPALGSQWGTVDRFDDSPMTLTQLFWEQRLFDDGARVIVGKLNPDNYYNANVLSNDDLYFLNKVFSSNPARAHPQEGLGFVVRVDPSKKWYILAGAQDSNANERSVDFASVAKLEFMYAAEIGLNLSNDTTVRTTLYYFDSASDLGLQSTFAAAISFEQEVLDGESAFFFRMSWMEKPASRTEFALALGSVVAGHKWGRQDDVLGVGLGWGRPFDHSLTDQFNIEFFYRIQVTKVLTITPNAQLILDPTYRVYKQEIGVFSLRARILW
jgi:porin